MIPQKLKNKLIIVGLLLGSGLLFFLIPTFFLAFTESNYPAWYNNNHYVKYGLQALFGIFSGVSASLFFIVFLKFFNNDDKFFKPEIDYIYNCLDHLKKRECAALKDNLFSDDILATSKLIANINETKTIAIRFFHDKFSEERNKYKNSTHILTLSFDLLRGYYSEGSPGLNRLLEEKNLSEEHAIRRIVIFEDDITDNPLLKDFIGRFDRCNWKIINRGALIDEQKSMFRDFAIFFNKDKVPEKAFFTYISGSMENLFTKASWTPYCTYNKEYIKNLHGRFEKLWSEPNVHDNIIKAWLAKMPPSKN